VKESFLIGMFHRGAAPKERKKVLKKSKQEGDVWLAYEYLVNRPPEVDDAIVYTRDLTPEQMIATPEVWQEYIILPPVAQIVK
jgi:hypothetical protein